MYYLINISKLNLTKLLNILITIPYDNIIIGCSEIITLLDLINAQLIGSAFIDLLNDNIDMSIENKKMIKQYCNLIIKSNTIKTLLKVHLKYIVNIDTDAHHYRIPNKLWNELGSRIYPCIGITEKYKYKFDNTIFQLDEY